MTEARGITTLLRGGLEATEGEVSWSDRELSGRRMAMTVTAWRGKLRSRLKEIAHGEVNLVDDVMEAANDQPNTLGV